MSEKFYIREEVLEALRIATEGRATAEGDQVSASEVDQLAREIGVDGARLREILAGGTGTIRSKDNVSGGIGWPGNEEFERVISGELSAGDLEETADMAGARFEDQGSTGTREAREFWEGFRYVTMDISTREGRTRILAKSKISFLRLAPFFPFLFIIPVIALKFASRDQNFDMETAVQGIITLGAMVYFGIGWGMRSSRKKIQKRIDLLAEDIQERIRQARDYQVVDVGAPLEDDLKHESAILGDDSG